MTSTHLVPLYIKDVRTQQPREATQAEADAYFAKHKFSHIKWMFANRKAMHDKLVEEGTSDKAAWAEAFKVYPKPGSEAKPRFMIT